MSYSNLFNVYQKAKPLVAWLDDIDIGTATDGYPVYFNNKKYSTLRADVIFQLKDKIRWYFYSLISKESVSLDAYGLYDFTSSDPGQMVQYLVGQTESTPYDEYYSDECGGLCQEGDSFPVELKGKHWCASISGRSPVIYEYEDWMEGVPFLDEISCDSSGVYTVTKDEYCTFEKLVLEFFQWFFPKEAAVLLLKDVSSHWEDFLCLYDDSCAPDYLSYTDTLVYELVRYFDTVLTEVSEKNLEIQRLTFQFYYKELSEYLSAEEEKNVLEVISKLNTSPFTYLYEENDYGSYPLTSYAICVSRALGIVGMYSEEALIKKYGQLPSELLKEIKDFQDLISSSYLHAYPDFSLYLSDESATYLCSDLAISIMPITTYYGMDWREGCDTRFLRTKNLFFLNMADELYDEILKYKEMEHGYKCI